MTAEAIRNQLQLGRPFRLRTADGKTVSVPRPGFALLSPGGKTLILFHKGESYEVLSVQLIAAIEVAGQKAGGD